MLQIVFPFGWKHLFALHSSTCCKPESPELTPLQRQPLKNNLSFQTNYSKLPDDNGGAPKLNRVVGGLIPNREIVSLLDKETSLVVKCLPCSQKKEKEKEKEKTFVLKSTLPLESYSMFDAIRCMYKA